MTEEHKNKTDMDSYYEVTQYTDEELMEELTRPSTHTIKPFHFHVLKEAVRRILEILIEKEEGDTIK